MVVTLFVFSLLAGAGDAFAQRAPVAKDRVLRSEDFYTGIFLARGPVAERIPQIRENLQLAARQDPQVTRLVDDFHARLLVQIRTVDPTFLARFGTTMRSGDPSAIDSMIGEGAKVTLQAVRTMPEVVALRANIEKDPQYLTKLVDGIRQNTGNKIDEGTIRQAINLVATNASLSDIGDPTTNTTFAIAVVAVAALVAATYVLVVHAAAAVWSVAGAAVLAVYFAAWTPFNKDPLSARSGELVREELVHAIATTF
jgi:hypothetical protein